MFDTCTQDQEQLVNEQYQQLALTKVISANHDQDHLIKHTDKFYTAQCTLVAHSNCSTVRVWSDILNAHVDHELSARSKFQECSNIPCVSSHSHIHLNSVLLLFGDSALYHSALKHCLNPGLFNCGDTPLKLQWLLC